MLNLLWLRYVSRWAIVSLVCSLLCICGDVVITSKRFWGSWLFQFASRGLLWGRKFLPQSGFCEIWKGFQPHELSGCIGYGFKLWRISTFCITCRVVTWIPFQDFLRGRILSRCKLLESDLRVFNQTTSFESGGFFLSRFVYLIVVVNLVVVSRAMDDTLVYEEDGLPTKGDGSASPQRRNRIFDDKMRNQCWQKADVVPGRHPERWRKDVAGNVVCRRLTRCEGCLCYEYDHIRPFSKGFSSVLFAIYQSGLWFRG